MAEEFYTTEELARMLKCHVLTVRRRIYAGELKAFKDKRRWMVSRKEFERYQEERSRPEPPTPEVGPEAPIVSELKPNQIACLFSPGGGIRQVIRDELDRAKEEIALAIYDLTMRTLCRALERAHQRGSRSGSSSTGPRSQGASPSTATSRSGGSTAASSGSRESFTTSSASSTGAGS